MKIEIILFSVKNYHKSRKEPKMKLIRSTLRNLKNSINPLARAAAICSCAQGILHFKLKNDLKQSEAQLLEKIKVQIFEKYI